MEKYIGIVSEKQYSEFISMTKKLNQKDCLSINNSLHNSFQQATKSSVAFESTDKLKGRELKKQYEGSEQAFRYLNSTRYNSWEEEDIIQADYLITQGAYGFGYRDRRVFIQGSEVSVPSPDRVPYHMKHFSKILKEDINPLETSILLHFAGVRIHPFEDGNGRTFRLCQNVILYQNKMFPFSINSHMKKEYFGLLEKASVEWLDTYDGVEKYRTYDYIFSQLYLTPKINMQKFASFITEKIITQMKKACK